MAATNFDTFYVSPDYVMPNSWKDSRHITDDSAATCIRATRSSCFSTLATHGFGRGGPIVSPPLSPDMTPLDFHFWGYMKTVVYETPVQTQQDLVARIQVAPGVIRDRPGIYPRVRHDIIN